MELSKLTGESVDGELQWIRSGRRAKAAPGPEETSAEWNPQDRVSREAAVTHEHALPSPLWTPSNPANLLDAQNGPMANLGVGTVNIYAAYVKVATSQLATEFPTIEFQNGMVDLQVKSLGGDFSTFESSLTNLGLQVTTAKLLLRGCALSLRRSTSQLHPGRHDLADDHVHERQRPDRVDHLQQGPRSLDGDRCPGLANIFVVRQGDQRRMAADRRRLWRTTSISIAFAGVTHRYNPLTFTVTLNYDSLPQTEMPTTSTRSWS